MGCLIEQIILEHGNLSIVLDEPISLKEDKCIWMGFRYSSVHGKMIAYLIIGEEAGTPAVIRAYGEEAPEYKLVTALPTYAPGKQGFKICSSPNDCRVEYIRASSRATCAPLGTMKIDKMTQIIKFTCLRPTDKGKHLSCTVSFRIRGEAPVLKGKLFLLPYEECRKLAGNINWVKLPPNYTVGRKKLYEIYLVDARDLNIVLLDPCCLTTSYAGPDADVLWEGEISDENAEVSSILENIEKAVAKIVAEKLEKAIKKNSSEELRISTILRERREELRKYLEKMT